DHEGGGRAWRHPALPRLVPMVEAAAEGQAETAAGGHGVLQVASLLLAVRVVVLGDQIGASVEIAGGGALVQPAVDEAPFEPVRPQPTREVRAQAALAR